jgi:N-dimethylarginine dimethylaminohydrolase
MANPTKSMGTAHETAIVNWFRSKGWKWTHRRTQKGSDDEGDVCLSERIPFTIEAKNSKRSTERAAIGAWLRELEEEVNHVGDDAGAVIHKRRGTTDVGEYVVLMPVKYLEYLLDRAYPEEKTSTKRVLHR